MNTWMDFVQIEYTNTTNQGGVSFEKLPPFVSYFGHQGAKSENGFCSLTYEIMIWFDLNQVQWKIYLRRYFFWKMVAVLLIFRPLGAKSENGFRFLMKLWFDSNSVKWKIYPRVCFLLKMAAVCFIIWLLGAKLKTVSTL